MPFRVLPNGFATAVKLTVPEVPSGELAVVAVSQFAKLRAVLEHPCVAVEKLNDPPAPDEARVPLVELRIYVHGPAASLTTNDCPATVSVPDRTLEVLLGEATNTTSDVPALPLDDMVSQGAVWSVAEDQWQADGAVTETLPVPPPYGMEEFADPSV